MPIILVHRGQRQESGNFGVGLSYIETLPKN